MQTSINLQEPFTYSVIPLVVSICAILAITGYLIYTKIIKQKSEQKEEVIKEIPEKNIKDIPAIKGKYLNILNSIEYKYTNKMIGIRKAYQLISESIRLFQIFMN